VRQEGDKVNLARVVHLTPCIGLMSGAEIKAVQEPRGTIC